MSIRKELELTQKDFRHLVRNRCKVIKITIAEDDAVITIFIITIVIIIKAVTTRRKGAAQERRRKLKVPIHAAE